MDRPWEVVEKCIRRCKKEDVVEISRLRGGCEILGCDKGAVKGICIPLGSGPSMKLRLCRHHTNEVLKALRGTEREVKIITSLPEIELATNEERAQWLESLAAERREEAKRNSSFGAVSPDRLNGEAQGYETGAKVLRKLHDKQIREFVLDLGGNYNEPD